MIKVEFYLGQRGPEALVVKKGILPAEYWRGARLVPARPWEPLIGVEYEVLLGREISPGGGRRLPVVLVAGVDPRRDEAAAERAVAEKAATEKIAAEGAVAEEAAQASRRERVSALALEIEKKGGLGTAPRFNLLFRCEAGILRGGWIVRPEDLQLIEKLERDWQEVCQVLTGASAAAEKVKEQFAERIREAENRLEALKGEKPLTFEIMGHEVNSDFMTRELVTRSRRVCYGASSDERMGPVEVMETSPQWEVVPVEGEVLQAARVAFGHTKGLLERIREAASELQALERDLRWESGTAWKESVHCSGLTILVDRLGEVNPHYFK